MGLTKQQKEDLLAQASRLVVEAGGPEQASYSPNELADQMGLSHERGRQWVAKAIRRARHTKRSPQEESQ